MAFPEIECDCQWLQLEQDLNSNPLASTWPEALNRLQKLPMPHLWPAKLRYLLPEIPWHDKLNKLYFNTPSFDYRRGFEGFLRLQAFSNEDTIAYSGLPLIQPRENLLTQIENPLDIIAVSLVPDDQKTPSCILILEKLHVNNPMQLSPGKSAIAEGLAGITYPHETIRQLITQKPELINNKNLPMNPKPVKSGWRIINGDMTFIGIYQGQLCVIPILGSQYDLKWDLARSLMRRYLPNYKRMDMQTRISQNLLAQQIEVSEIMAPERIYPVSHVYYIDTRKFEFPASLCSPEYETSDQSFIKRILLYQLMYNPLYNDSQHWRINPIDHNRRIMKIIDSLIFPPDRLTWLSLNEEDKPGAINNAIEYISEQL